VVVGFGEKLWRGLEKGKLEYFQYAESIMPSE
jgi:hypothetical protein